MISPFNKTITLTCGRLKKSFPYTFKGSLLEVVILLDNTNIWFCRNSPLLKGHLVELQPRKLLVCLFSDHSLFVTFDISRVIVIFGKKFVSCPVNFVARWLFASLNYGEPLLIRQLQLNDHLAVYWEWLLNKGWIIPFKTARRRIAEPRKRKNCIVSLICKLKENYELLETHQHCGFSAIYVFYTKLQYCAKISETCDRICNKAHYNWFRINTKRRSFHSYCLSFPHEPHTS